MKSPESMKWQDNFYMELHPYPKLVLNYMYDNADVSGFIDYNVALWLTQIKGLVNHKKYPTFTKQDLLSSLSDLKIKLLSDGKKKLFIKDFLKHKKKLPLIKGVEEHDLILTKLQSNLERFGNAPEIATILNSVKDLKQIKPVGYLSNGLKKEKNKDKRFTAPSFEEFKQYYLSQKADANIESIQNLFDHYVSCGWKVGNKPMKDYEAAIRNGIRKEGKSKYSNNSETKKSRTETTLSVVDELKHNR